MAKSSKPNVEINATINGVEDIKEWCKNNKKGQTSQSTLIIFSIIFKPIEKI